MLFSLSCDDSPTKPDETAPATPEISVSADTLKLTISWSAIEKAETYILYWATTAGVTEQSNTVPNLTETDFTHVGLSNGVTYYYRVAARSAAGLTSTLSAEKSGSPLAVTIDPPQKFTATAGDTTITLSWERSAGAATYSLYWDTTSGITTQSKAIDNIAALTYEHTGLTNGKTYYYCIVGKDGASGSSALSKEISATPLSSVPAPKNLTAKPGNAYVQLNIDKYPGGKTTTFRIYWATTAGITTASDTIVDQSGKGITFPHTVTNVTNGTTYYYRVSAIDAGIESALSNEVSAKPSEDIPIAPPEKVTAQKGDKSVTLSWGAVIGAATYNVYWATKAGITLNADSITGITKTGYTHSGLTNLTTYYYRVSALDGSGKASDLSVEVSATPDTSSSGHGPKNVVATPGSGKITLTWDLVNGGLGYVIFGDTKPGITDQSPTVGDKLPANVNTFTHDNLTAGTTYYYKVGVWVQGNGGKYELYLSKEVSAKPAI